MSPRDLIGRRIIGVRPLTRAESETLAWPPGEGLALDLEGTITLIMARDPECNGPGSLIVAAPAWTELEVLP